MMGGGAEVFKASRCNSGYSLSNTSALQLRDRLERNPRDGEALYGLAMLAHRERRLIVAAKLARMAIAADTRRPEYHNILGAIYGDLNRWSEAIVAFEAAICACPSYAPAHRNKAVALVRAGHLVEAIAAYHAALERDASPDLCEDLIAACHQMADVPGIIDARRKSIALRPDDPRLQSDLLYLLHHVTDEASPHWFAEHFEWGRRHGCAFSVPFHSNDPDPRRRLRVGYVSSGFRAHPAARFQLAEMAARDRAAYELTCYASAITPDAWAQRVQAAADRWVDISKLSDDEAADLIRRDGIDILVDLDGHSTGNRLGIFARKPAPVQATYNGYINTTGLPQMDWRITDALHDPAGMTERWHTERLWRLAGGNWCYMPDDFVGWASAHRIVAEESQCESESGAGLQRDTSGVPMVDGGLKPTLPITFGSLNKFIKASDPCLRVWAKLMTRVPDARLLVAVPGAPAVNRFPLQRMIDHGIPADRVTVVGRSRTRREYLDRFGQIDIHLDTFPFNGITTTCDGLWQGVPTVTLEGNAFHSRAGVSLMTSVGLPELIAKSEDEYVEIAATLANDRPRLTEIRRTLRPRMAASPLCDGPRLARALEAAYRAMWVDWCERQGR